MAREMDAAIHDNAILLIDGPTGIGKGYAALAPLARAGPPRGAPPTAPARSRCGSSCSPRTSPRVQAAFCGPQASLLKGFTHYLCRLIYGAGPRTAQQRRSRSSTAGPLKPRPEISRFCKRWPASPYLGRADGPPAYLGTVAGPNGERGGGMEPGTPRAVLILDSHPHSDCLFDPN
jgi:hypothetical protein